MNYKIIKPF